MFQHIQIKKEQVFLSLGFYSYLDLADIKLPFVFRPDLNDFDQSIETLSPVFALINFLGLDFNDWTLDEVLLEFILYMLIVLIKTENVTSFFLLYIFDCLPFKNIDWLAWHILSA